jgi:hypothetical protein
MAITRSEHRAFPRFACSVKVRFTVGDVEGEGQLIDVSSGGCKLLPFELESLMAADMMPGTALMIAAGNAMVAATTAWMTPNFSALGCTFGTPLAADLLEMLVGETSRNDR